MELVDVLAPPTFEPTGLTKPARQAIDDEDWLGTFNLWIARLQPEPSLIYQLRPDHGWAPNLLDASAGGYYLAGERLVDGLREVEEELGKRYEADTLTYLGKRLSVSYDAKGRERKSVVDIFITIDETPLATFTLSPDEVQGVFCCPLEALERVHKQKDASFEAEGVSSRGEPVRREVSADSFPYNWDNYHWKMVPLARRFLTGEKELLF